MKRNLLLSFPKAARLLLAALICLPFWGTTLMAQTAQPEAYAVFDSSTSTLTFKYDNNKPADAYLMNTGKAIPGWYADRQNIKKVVFDPSFAGARPTSCYGWFYNCQNLTDIEGISNLNTEEVTITSAMFERCKQLTSLDISHFDTEKVTDMSFMFNNCEKIASLDISSFDTRNVEYISAMFQKCSSLTSLDLSHFNTEKVTDMSSMFYGCSSLTSLDLSSFNTGEVTDMSGMISNCTSLESLNISSFNTDKVTDMSFMFDRCEKLASLNISSFNTKNVEYMISMFQHCSSLTSLDISNFDTEKVTYMSALFKGCKNLTSLDISSFNTKNATNISFMFTGCHALATIYASDKFVVTNVESDNNMFAECLKLKGAIEYDENKTNSSYANYTTGYFTLKLPTSINAINGNDKAEYFDINGKRGTKLQRGINLVRRGSKTYKVVVK